jgi:hypothetical protein
VREAPISSDPWALPNPVIVLLIPAVSAVAVPTLFGYGIAVLVRGRRRRDRVLRGLVALAAAATIAVYAWGALHMIQDQTSANDTCQQAVGPAHAGDISAYETSLIPLHFACRVDGAGSYEPFVPGFVNPTALALALLTCLLAAAAQQAKRVTPIPSTTGGTTS